MQELLIRRANISDIDLIYHMTQSIVELLPEPEFFAADEKDNFLSMGYEIMMTKLKYGGMERHILLKTKIKNRNLKTEYRQQIINKKSEEKNSKSKLIIK